MKLLTAQGDMIVLPTKKSTNGLYYKHGAIFMMIMSDATI